MKKAAILVLILCTFTIMTAQTPTFKPSIGGSVGATYEHYGLSVNPISPNFYRARRPYNQVRFNIAPIIQLGKNFNVPLNFNFVTKPTNFLGPFAMLGVGGRMNFKQFITNPLNNFSINPKYKWAEVQLGTQYLNYTELTTGDIGIFGAGVNLKPPKNYVFKFFTGTSQQSINPVLPTNLGAYTRNHWMMQVGKEKEEKYTALITLAKGKDKNGSTSPFPLLPNPANVDPQEAFVMSVTGKYKTKKGLYVESELAQGLFTTNTTVGGIGLVSSIKPFITANSVTTKDYAGHVAFGRKTKHFDIGLKTKYLGAGYRVMGFPFMQPDRLDATINTRFDAWKDKNGIHKMNVVASVGNRINNFSGSSGAKANQLIANINWFTQFSEKFNLNVSYNNFGFNSNGASFGLPTFRNVSNDFSVSPTWIWSNTKMSNVLTMNYSISKYKESLIIPPSSTPTITNNATHTAMINYIPTFFERKAAPEFSVLYFYNKLPGFVMQLFTIGTGVSAPLYKNKIRWKGQVQYTIGNNQGFTNNNNLVFSAATDIALTKKLNWNISANSNLFQYGNELVGPVVLNGANYLESFIRTGINYRIK
jgi:hypothetical protein